MPGFTSQQVRVFCDSIHQGATPDEIDHALSELKSDPAVTVTETDNDVTVKHGGAEYQITRRIPK